MITLIRDVNEKTIITYDDLLLGEKSNTLSYSDEFHDNIINNRVYARNHLKKGRLLQFVDVVIK